MRELGGKSAFVTGGASGIGLALGRAFVRAGMKVMLADIEPDALAAAGDAGVVADHMDVAERRVRRLGRALDAHRIGNVTGNALHIRPDIAQAFDGRRQGVRLDVGQHHLHARLRECPAERQPDAARPARHECRLAAELSHDSFVRRRILRMTRRKISVSAMFAA